ncbi:hypothetical protein VPNG_06408 [Cytospora leucostoma]|uniref:Ig-like domain-containing protein n=1 Tax=Cytospora leucostoma TaxID=1230097 RepID=A0A423WZ61_9PEZI|nr:hypothetical protein VPNG_06408 [Cytospora leucostoma]
MRLPFSQGKRASYSALPVSRHASSSNLQGDEAKFSLDSQIPSSRPSKSARLVLSHILLAALSISGTVLYARWHMQDSGPRPPKPIVCHCGSSVAEAKALNCTYDTLSVSWLPPHCREDELTAEFDRAGPNGTWPYYADKNATIPISLEAMSLLADLPRAQAVFYTSTGWHVAHCAFYWRKEYRMRARGLMTESRYDKESHIEHCYEIFKSDDPLHEVNVASPVWLGGDGPDSGHHHHEAQ